MFKSYGVYLSNWRGISRMYAHFKNTPTYVFLEEGHFISKISPPWQHWACSGRSPTSKCDQVSCDGRLVPLKTACLRQFTSGEYQDKFLSMVLFALKNVEGAQPFPWTSERWRWPIIFSAKKVPAQCGDFLGKMAYPSIATATVCSSIALLPVCSSIAFYVNVELCSRHIQGGWAYSWIKLY